MIETLKRLSPVPIRFTLWMSVPGYEGMFFYNGHYKGSTNKIEILDSLLLHEKLATLAHEIGHALCYEKGCKCLQPEIIEKNHVLTEIHAYKFVLGWLLKNKQRVALTWEMKRIKENGLSSEMGHYTKAAKHVMKLKLWQKCLDYVK